jgi:hypothetical protein
MTKIANSAKPFRCLEIWRGLAVEGKEPECDWTNPAS